MLVVFLVGLLNFIYNCNNQNNEKSKDVKGDDDIDPSQIDENGVYKWKEFIGAKVRLSVSIKNHLKFFFL